VFCSIHRQNNPYSAPLKKAPICMGHITPTNVSTRSTYYVCSLIYYFNHFLRQLRFCRLFVEYSISPAICQYVRLHSTIRLLTMCFQKITYTKVNDTFFQFTRLLRQAYVSYRCIKPKRLLHYKIMYLRQFPGTL